jgi:hypothetical protein
MVEINNRHPTNKRFHPSNQKSRAKTIDYIYSNQTKTSEERIDELSGKIECLQRAFANYRCDFMTSMARLEGRLTSRE